MTPFNLLLSWKLSVGTLAFRVYKKIIGLKLLLVLFFGATVTSVSGQSYRIVTNIDDTITVTCTGEFGGTYWGPPITIPNTIEDKPVTRIGDNAFINQYFLTGVTIPDTVISIGDNAFKNCQNLTSCNIPSNLISVGACAFWGTDLTSVTLGEKVNHIGSEAFSLCSFLATITVSPSNSTYSSLDGVLFDKQKTTIMQFPSCKGGNYIIPDSVTNIGIALQQTGISGVVIPNSMTFIGDGAFYCCGNLSSVTIPDSVTSIGDYAFDRCALSSVTIPNGVTSIGGYAFAECPMGSVSIGTNVTSIGGCAFYGTGLRSIMIPDSVINIGGGAFTGCGGLTSATIGVNASYIDEAAFGKCVSLQAINVSPSNSAYSSMDGVLFDKDQASIIKYPTGKGGGYMIPKSVTSLGETAFMWNSSLTGVYFKCNAPSVGYYTFYGTSLTVYYYPWTSGWTNTFGERPTQVNPDYTQWLTDYGFTTSLTNDYDNDKMLNWQEYLAGTNPTNDADRLAIASTGSGTNAQISWLAKSNISYQVMKSLNLMDVWSYAPSGTGTNQQSLQTATENTILQYADPNFPSFTSAFYQVTVSAP